MLTLEDDRSNKLNTNQVIFKVTVAVGVSIGTY